MFARARRRACSPARPAPVALGIILLAIALLTPRSGEAAPLCDAGGACADDDGDGFAACGCTLSGSPCDCDDADPATYPGAPETCDSTKDLDCSGATPNACGAKKACLARVCVPECVPLADFGCPAGSVMIGDPDGGGCLCQPKSCSVFGCPAGLSCDEQDRCVPTCGAGVRCPPHQVCRGSGCVDPCRGLSCPAGTTCEGGRCVVSCACASSPCAPGATCDLGAPVPRCVETACVGVSCAEGAHCMGGACVDDCEGVVCPPRRVCARVSVNGGAKEARCVDLCSPSPCKHDWSCDFRTGACSPPPADTRSVPGPSAPEALVVGGAGWLCNVTVPGKAPLLTPLLMAALGLRVLLRERRRRRRD